VAYAWLALFLIGSCFLARPADWHRNGELRTLLESIAMLVGIVTGAVLLVRYYTKCPACATFHIANRAGHHPLLTF
jgi:hypothetical protein